MVSAGRPSLPEEEKREIVSIRLNQEELNALDAYCKRKGWTRAHAIREWIKIIAQ